MIHRAQFKQASVKEFGHLPLRQNNVRAKAVKFLRLMNEPVWVLDQAVLSVHKMRLSEHGGSVGLRNEALEGGGRGSVSEAKTTVC